MHCDNKKMDSFSLMPLSFTYLTPEDLTNRITSLVILKEKRLRNNTKLNVFFGTNSGEIDM